jgi:alkanesulfonate monooxygenase
VSNGRLLVNLVTGGDVAELEGDGLFLNHAERYEASAEFIRVWRDLLAASHENGEISFEGKHVTVKGARAVSADSASASAGVLRRVLRAAHDLAAEQVETYLTWGEPPADVAKKIADVRAAPRSTAARCASASACT